MILSCRDCFHDDLVPVIGSPDGAATILLRFQPYLGRDVGSWRRRQLPEGAVEDLERNAAAGIVSKIPRDLSPCRKAVDDAPRLGRHLERRNQRGDHKRVQQGEDQKRRSSRY